MSRLLRDATRTNQTNQQLSAARKNQDRFDDGFEVNDDPFEQDTPLPAQPPRKKPEPANWREEKPPTSSKLDYHQSKKFAKEFQRGLKDFELVDVPREIHTFRQLDQIRHDKLSDLRTDVFFESDRLNSELQTAFIELKALEANIEQAASLGSDKQTLVSLLLSRKDLQKKVGLLTYKKMRVLTALEGLENFEMFADLSSDMNAYKSVCDDFFSKQKLPNELDAIQPETQMSVVYSSLHNCTEGFLFDKEPIHEYLLVDDSVADSERLKLKIEDEYAALRKANQSPLHTKY